jgi:hypothetical protein
MVAGVQDLVRGVYQVVANLRELDSTGKQTGAPGLGRLTRSDTSASCSLLIAEVVRDLPHCPGFSDTENVQILSARARMQRAWTDIYVRVFGESAVDWVGHALQDLSAVNESGDALTLLEVRAIGVFDCSSEVAAESTTGDTIKWSVTYNTQGSSSDRKCRRRPCRTGSRPQGLHCALVDIRLY